MQGRARLIGFGPFRSVFVRVPRLVTVRRLSLAGAFLRIAFSAQQLNVRDVIQAAGREWHDMVVILF
jgi:hypothetical protein